MVKLSEILKDWPEKKTDTVQFIHEDSVEDTDIVLKPERAHNLALTSCNREIDREALAKEIYPYLAGAIGGISIGAGLGWSDKKQKFLEKQTNDLAKHIISTMPAWLKRIEK